MSERGSSWERQPVSGLARRLGGGTRRSLTAVTVGVVCFVVVLIGSAFWIAARERDADDAVIRTVQNEDHLAVVQSLLQDAEIGQRGFLLTGDPLYLEPYTNSLNTIGRELDALDAGIADNPRQQANVAALRPLVAEKLSELRQTVERRRAGDAAGALTILQAGQGKMLMDGVRDVVARMRAEEERLLAQRTVQARHSAIRLEAAIIGLALIAAILALIALRTMTHRARSAEATRDELLARFDRRLLAVMAADVVGYSSMMEGDEALTLTRLRDARSRIDGLIARHGGSIVSTAGDSVLAVFESALAAVDCAVEIQRTLSDERQAAGTGQSLALRIGINVGDVIVHDGDVFGDTVNVAARLEPLAEPGGICVSRAVRDHVRKQRGLTFEDLGFKTVKNIAQPVSVFSIGCDRAEKDAA